MDWEAFERVALRRLALQSQSTKRLQTTLAEYRERWLSGDHGEEVKDTIAAILAIFRHRGAA